MTKRHALAFAVLLAIVGCDSRNTPWAKPHTTVTAHTFHLRQKNRMLLVFAPSPDHPELLRQRAFQQADADGYEERDLHPVEVTDATADALFSRYGVDPTKFTVILIGRDGEEKKRSDVALASAELFATIDAMPMRQAEMDRPR